MSLENIKLSSIGSGNMGFALMKGASGLINPDRIGFSDALKAKAEEAAGALGARVYSSNTQAVEEGDFIFLAVKPQVLEAVLKEIAPALKARLEKALESGGKAEARPPVLVSMAAGWSI